MRWMFMGAKLVFLVLAFFLPFNLWSIIVINLGVLLVNESGRVCNFFGIYRVVIWPNFEENREVFMKKEKREAAVFFFFLSLLVLPPVQNWRWWSWPVNLWPVQSKFDRFNPFSAGSARFRGVSSRFKLVRSVRDLFEQFFKLLL